MKKILATVLLILTLSTFAQPQNPGVFVWFDHIQSPLGLAEGQLMEVTEKVRDALRQNLPADRLMATLPEDPSQRIVFLTIGDDLWPARTYFGTGLSFQDALRTAIHILRVNEKAKAKEIVKHADAIAQEARQKNQPPPQDWMARKTNPGHWNWLKLQIVQATKPVNNFSFNHSKFAFSDLVGFAFGPSLGFAFTPDQITGRYLLTKQNFVSKKQVANIIAEAFNFEALSTWLRASNVQQEQRICLFEVDTYYTDGVTTMRLFRGHQLPSIPTATQCTEAASAAARAVAERLVPATGELRAPFPDWKQGTANGEAPEDLAEFALALHCLADTTGNQAFLDPARQAMKTVTEAIVTYGKPQKAAVTVPENLPENSPRQPRTIAPLETNALALLAILRTEPDKPEARRQAAQLATFILSLRKPDGTFHSAKLIPSEQTFDYRKHSWQTKASDHALAIVALKQAAQTLDNQDWERQARQAHDHLVESLSRQSNQMLATISPWIAEAVAAFPPASRYHINLMPKLAAALLAARCLNPVAPDLAGALEDYPPDTTAAARNAWAVATLATWLAPYKPDYEEALTAENAVTVACHLQAQLNMPAATALPRPKFYLDFFRDRLDGFSCSLATQTAQIFALAKNARNMNAFHKGTFPDARTAELRLRNTRKFINLHPAFLNTETISNHRGVSEESRAVMGEISNRKESKVTPQESGLFQPKN